MSGPRVFALAALALCAGCATNSSRDHANSSARDHGARVGQNNPTALRKLAAEKPLDVDYTANTPSASATPVSATEHANGLERTEKKDDAKFELQLKHLDIDAKAPLEGTLTTNVPAKELKLLWVDGAQRVMGEFNLDAFKAKDGAIEFNVNMPANCIGQLQRVAVARFFPRESESIPALPPALVAQARFQVHAPQPWDGYVVLLRNGEYLGPKAWQKLREGGVNGGACEAGAAPTTFTRQALPFLSELIAPDENLLKPGKSLEETYFQYRKTRDAADLQRGRSFFDDSAIAPMTQRIDAGLTTKRGYLPLGWSLGDALGLTPASQPFDGNMARGTQDVFRGWLEQRYHSLAALNREWGSQFKAWSKVYPPTTDQMLLPPEPHATSLVPEPIGSRSTGGNFAAWSDFRAFNEFAFARLLREFKTQLQKDANTPYEVRTGVTGLGLTSPFTGWDMAQTATVLDWAEEHDDAYSRELLRHFAPSMRWLSQLRGSSPKDVYQLWDRWLRGDCGCIADVQMFVDEKQEALPAAKALSADFRALSGGLTPLRQNAQPVHDPVAIYYSPRSLDLNWLLDAQARGGDWMDRGAASSSGLNALRAWSMLLEDLGYAPAYVNAQELSGGALQKTHTRVLILPRVVALSDEEAAAIRAFARGGGVVLADGACGTFDGSGKRRTANADGLVVGALDSDFGLARKDLRVLDASDARADRVTLLDAVTGKPAGPSSPDLRVFEPGIVAHGSVAGAVAKSGAPALLLKGAGSGHFVYLNLNIEPYAMLRTSRDADLFMYYGLTSDEYDKQFGRPTGGEALRLVIGDLLSEAAPGSPLKIWSEDSLPVHGVRQARFLFGKDHELFGLQSALTPGEKETTGQNVWVGLNGERYWYDIRNGQYLGAGKAVKARLEALRPTFLAALPYKVEHLNLKVRRVDPRGSYTVSAAVITAFNAEPGTHLLHAELTNEAGVVLPAYTQNYIAAEGKQDFQIVLGLNEPAGTYHLIVRDVETGVGGGGDLLKEVSEYSQLSDVHP